MEEYFSKLSALKESANGILTLYDEIERQMNKRELKELPQPLRKIVLGGLKEEGEFSENALGLFYKEVFGISFDLNKLIRRARTIPRKEEEIPPKVYEVEVSVSKTDFIKIVEAIATYLEGVPWAKIPKIGVKKIELDNPYIGVEHAKDFLEKAVELSPASCPESFLVLALNGITTRYMRIASHNFPQLKEENLENLKKFLEFSKLLEPDLPEEGLCQEYTFWGFPPRTIGHSIFQTIGCIWEITEIPVIQKYFGIKSELERYIERAVPAWQRAFPKGKTAHETIRKIKSILYSEMPEEKAGMLGGRISSKVYNLTKSYPVYGRLLMAGDRAMLSYYYSKGEIELTYFIDVFSPALFFKIGGIGRWTAWGEGAMSLSSSLSNIKREYAALWMPIMEV